MSQYDQSGMRGFERNRPEEMGALATRVISVLRDRQVVAPSGVRQFVLDEIVRAVISRSAFNAALLLDEIRGHRLSIDTIIDLYIPHAARAIGTGWAEDDISFADVTVGALRLQALLGEASMQSRTDLSTDDTRPHAMVVLPQGEQHFLGVSVVAAQLRRIGCEVTVSFDEALGCLSARLKDERPDLVLISCARRETLKTATETIQTIRAALPKGPVIALGGAVLDDADDLKEQTGVDIVTSSAKDAVAFCAKSGKTPPVS